MAETTSLSTGHKNTTEQDILADYPNYLTVFRQETTCRICSYELATTSFESTTINVCSTCHELATQLAENPKLCKLCSSLFTVPADTRQLFSTWGWRPHGLGSLNDGLRNGCPLCRLFLIQDPNPDPNRLRGMSLNLVADGFGEEGNYDADVEWEEQLGRLKSVSFSSEPDQYRLTMSVSAEADDPAARYISQRPLQENRSNNETTEIARGWLRDCLTNHDESKSRQLGVLPTRVLDVGGFGDHTVKLFESNGSRGDYVALSYCWGPPPFLRTLKDNYKAHKNGIAMLDLPATLKDAVLVTRTLGFQYIWIDALCILQDSDEDKNNELGKMEDIYAKAILTIAAASSKSVSLGFLDQKNSQINVKVPFRCPDDILGSVWISPLVIVDLKKVPLFTRAWCMQEQYLSQRLLVYTDSEIFWQCQTHPVRRPSNTHITYLNDDPTHTGSPFARLVSSTFTAGKLTSKRDLTAGMTDEAAFRFNTWANIVMEYTNRNLSFESDKLPAISGIAHRFQEGWKVSYYAGLWESQFVNLLQWRRPHGNAWREYRPLDSYRAPSWSWASVEGSVLYPRFRNFDVGDLRNLRAQFIRCNLALDPRPTSSIAATSTTPTTPNPLFKCNPGTSVVLHAAIIPTSQSPYQHWATVGPEAGYISFDYHDPFVPLVDDFHDAKSVIREDLKESWLMMLGEARVGKKSTRLTALILKRIVANGNGGEERAEGEGWGGEVFARIGYFESSQKNASKSWAGKEKWREVTII